MTIMKATAVLNEVVVILSVFPSVTLVTDQAPSERLVVKLFSTLRYHPGFQRSSFDIDCLSSTSATM